MFLSGSTDVLYDNSVQPNILCRGKLTHYRRRAEQKCKLNIVFYKAFELTALSVGSDGCA
jgi:hypothetical protein